MEPCYCSPSGSFISVYINLFEFNVYFHQGAAAVAGAGVTQTICLPLLSVYEVSTHGASQVLKAIYQLHKYQKAFSNMYMM